MQLYSKVFVKDAYEYTGKAPISVRRFDMHKGDSGCPNYRSWLVARAGCPGCVLVEVARRWRLCSA